jgi:hypothetical protein
VTARIEPILGLPDISTRVLRTTAAYDAWVAARARLGEQATALFKLYGSLHRLPDAESLGLDSLAWKAHRAREEWQEAAAALPIGYELIVEIPAAAGGLPTQRDGDAPGEQVASC